MPKSFDVIQATLKAEHELNAIANALILENADELTDFIAEIRSIQDRMHKTHSEWEEDRNSG